MKTTVIKPGFLVALKTEVNGGVSYERQDLDAETGQETTIEKARERYKSLRDAAPDRVVFEQAFKAIAPEPSKLTPRELIEKAEKAAGVPVAEVTKWVTTKVVEDPEEHERATKIRNKARSLITAHCTPSSFSLLCPLDKEDELNEAIRQARILVDQFNASATHTLIGVFTVKGKIAATDDEAARAIASDITGLLDAMRDGINNLDAKAIRKAANEAKAMGAMLDESKQEAVSRSVEVARRAAREIVKRVDKGGEEGAKVLEEISLRPIESARFAFLDLDEQVTPEGEAMPAVSVQRFAELQ